MEKEEEPVNRAQGKEAASLQRAEGADTHRGAFVPLGTLRALENARANHRGEEGVCPWGICAFTLL